jgi:hypothetical protein
MSFLAYPSGRLVRRFDRIVVITGYSVFFGLDLMRLALEVTGRNGDIALRAQRAAIGVVGLAAVAALVSAGGPRAVQSGSHSSS